MLIVTGMPGSGKDEFIKVARSMGYTDVHMGDTVRKYSRSQNIDQKDYNIGKFAARREYSPAGTLRIHLTSRS